MRVKKTVHWVLFFLLIFKGVWSEELKISQEKLRDKIQGGWAGQVIGCTFGGPTEFRYRSTFIQDYQPLEWNEDMMIHSYENRPGLYDDIYMDLTFVQVFEEKGLDATAMEFAQAFAHAEYNLWHANMAARYNLLQGIPPPDSGHWLHNPHSDDIDFQIEADFAGLMCPGMVNSASAICDKIGHIMNYGDGWYGGVYVAAMYSLAFVSDDVQYVVEEALKVIPKQSLYFQCMTDVIKWHKEYPEDWKMTWFLTQKKWGEDIGCPQGVFNVFNIDAKINSAWILLGLLYGAGDFGKTLSISTRAGDDSDCNPASAGGILGCILGFNKIPDFWKQGLDKVEGLDFKYTTMSLKDAYDLSFKHALQIIELNRGRLSGDDVFIRVQEPKTVQLEQGFEGHHPVERRPLGIRLSDKTSFNFEGIGFVVNGLARKVGDKDHVFEVEMFIDGKRVETSRLPTHINQRKPTLFWRYGLSRRKHIIQLKVLNPSPNAEIRLYDLVVYSDTASKPKH